MTISKITLAAALAASALVAAPAFAQDAPASDFTITGNAAGVSDYRFRGVSLSDKGVAVQGSINLNHSSGFYVGTWGSSLAGFGSFGGSNAEIDVYGGYTKTIGNVTLDGGVYWYLYPSTDGTDVGEVYASVKGAFGPVTAKLGANYAPKQEAIGSVNNKDDNLYVYTDLSGGVPNTPVSLRAHLGRSMGDSTLTFGGDNYWDWNVGADVTWKNLTFGVSYVDTDLKKSVYQPLGLYKIVKSGAVFSLTAAF